MCATSTYPVEDTFLPAIMVMHASATAATATADMVRILFMDKIIANLPSFVLRKHAFLPLHLVAFAVVGDMGDMV